MDKELLMMTLRQLSGARNSITIPIAFVRFIGTFEAAVMLNQLLYWDERTENDFVAKTDHEWMEELFLTRYGVRCARKLLENKRIIRTEIHLFAGAPTVHYFLREEQLTEEWAEFIASLPKTPKQKTERTLSPQQRMVGTLAHVCKVDLKISHNAGRFCKTAKELLTAGYVPEDVSAAYGTWDSWWYSEHWKGAKGELPRTDTIKLTIQQAKEWNERRKTFDSTEPSGSSNS